MHCNPLNCNNTLKESIGWYRMLTETLKHKQTERQRQWHLQSCCSMFQNTNYIDNHLMNIVLFSCSHAAVTSGVLLLVNSGLLVWSKCKCVHYSTCRKEANSLLGPGLIRVTATCGLSTLDHLQRCAVCFRPNQPPSRPAVCNTCVSARAFAIVQMPGLPKRASQGNPSYKLWC